MTYLMRNLSSILVGLLLGCLVFLCGCETSTTCTQEVPPINLRISPSGDRYLLQDSFPTGTVYVKNTITIEGGTSTTETKKLNSPNDVLKIFLPKVKLGELLTVETAYKDGKNELLINQSFSRQDSISIISETVVINMQAPVRGDLSSGIESNIEILENGTLIGFGSAASGINAVFEIGEYKFTVKSDNGEAKITPFGTEFINSFPQDDSIVFRDNSTDAFSLNMISREGIWILKLTDLDDDANHRFTRAALNNQ